jgi:group II intron reverse transcriptase/maturase
LREPCNVLKSLSEKARDPQYKFQRLYRNLYNPEFYYLAYRNICANQGSMTPGADGLTVDNMSESRIQKIIASLQDFSYQPNPARRTYIPKKNSNKKRPLGIPSANDKLVQEIVRMLLESIYEPSFSNQSHGFRPNRSCHTALLQIQNTFTGIKWFVEGDIKACFDSFDHHVLVNILKRRIEDENFNALIWKLLRAGYMEQWTYNMTFSGTPQGSGVSPLLANIYLHELDMFIENYKEKFDTGGAGQNLDYSKAASKLFYIRQRNRKHWQQWDEQERAEALKIQKEAINILHSLPSKRQNNSSYKRIQYCRYADDFLVGVIGSHEDAQCVKTDIKDFLANTLKLEMSVEKTKITHCHDKARFLGFDVTISQTSAIKKDKRGQLRRCHSAVVKLYVPKEKWMSKLLEYGAISVRNDETGKEKWLTLHRGALINRTDIEILSKVNSEIRGMYNFYCIANNATVIKNFAHNMEYSMYKTFGRKYKCSVRQVIAKYSKDGKFLVPYETQKGKKFCELYNGGFKRKNFDVKFDTDPLPQYVKYDRPNQLRARIVAGICELCGQKIDDLRIHHVRKLKDLSGNTKWEQLMQAKRRKTLAVCPQCHAEIHKN